ncbi:hypothetical protein GCM10007874_45670 [Labrys miyagiensis]|uniref:Uncharacterized protein n=1 Tax=Labrys miyagiensis TaxID=346912 RepID=A0ABQ6CRJ1_9HYPH|nr:hypothetical protein GCM10007874_45670 [Labrys miyagiensis]
MIVEKQKSPLWLVRHEATNLAALAIIGSETANRDAKTDRLKAAREARDGDLPTLGAAPKKRKSVKTRRAQTQVR